MNTKTVSTLDLDAAIDTYLVACDVEGKSPRTIQAYAETLKQFRTICSARSLPRTPGEFSAPHVYEFLQAVAERGVSLGTRHRRYRETRAFFSWCLRMGYAERNPFGGIPNVRVELKLILPLNEEEIRALLAVCDPETEYGCRNRAMILILLDTGIRAAELHGLDLDDVDFETGRIHVRHGKGRKQRVVAFGPGPRDALVSYVEDYRGDEPGSLFLRVSRWGEVRQPFNPDHLGTLMQRIGAEAGVHANPHRFRHTFATWCVENSAREIDVQYLLGHSTSAMLRRYTASYNSVRP